MMRFEDFDIPIRTEPFGRHAGEGLQQIDAHREIARLDDGKGLRGLRNLGLFFISEAGCADDGGAHACVFQGV